VNKQSSPCNNANLSLKIKEKWLANVITRYEKATSMHKPSH